MKTLTERMAEDTIEIGDAYLIRIDRDEDGERHVWQVLMVRHNDVDKTTAMLIGFTNSTANGGEKPQGADYAAQIFSMVRKSAADIENAAGDFGEWLENWYGDEEILSLASTKALLRSFEEAQEQARDLRRFLGDEKYDKYLWETEDNV